MNHSLIPARVFAALKPSRLASRFDVPSRGDFISACRGLGIAGRGAALLTLGALLTFGGSGAALGQGAINGDTQYNFQNTAGSFSTGFTPTFPTAGDVNGQLNFGGTSYIATDDLATANVNNLTFNSSGLITINSGTATNVLTLTNNSLGIGPSIYVGTGNATINTILGGTVGFAKNGPGTLTLGTNADTFTGNAVVNSGALTVNNAQSATAGFVLNTGTTLTTNQALASTNIITVQGNSSLTLSALGAFNPLIVGNGNLTFSNGTTSLSTFGNGGSATATTLQSFGGSLIFGSNFSIRAESSSGNNSFVAPFATIDFAATTGLFNDRNGTSTFTLGGLAGTNAGATLAAGQNGTGTGTTTFIVGSANTSTSFAGTIVNGGTTTIAPALLTKVGTGTLTLTGKSTYTGTTTAAGGTLLLNFSVNNSALLGASALTFSGGTLSLLGNSGAAVASTQTLGTTTVNAGGGRIVLNANGGASTTLTLGTLTATATGGSLNVNAGANTFVTTTTNKDATGIYGGRITFTDANGNTNFATTTSGATPFTLSGYGAYTALNTTGGTTDTFNSSVTDSATLGGAVTTNSLKATNTTTGQALNLGNFTLTVTNGGLLFTGSNDYAINNGTLASGTATNSDLIIHQFGTGTLTIGAVITNGIGTSTLTKAGPGTLILSGQNNYTGATYLNNGVTVIGANANLGADATGATLNLNSATLRVTGTFGLFNGTAGTANRAVVIGGGGGTFDVTGANNLTIAGVISNPTNLFGPLIKTGSGTLTLLNAANTYGGETLISGGILSVGTLANGLSNSSIGSSPNTANALVLDSGTLQYTGAAVSTNRAFTLTQNGGTLDASGTGAVNFTNTLPIAFTGSGTRTLTLTGTNTGNNTLALSIANGTGGATTLNKTGPGRWVLTNPTNNNNAGNTFTGNTTISGGTLALTGASTNNIASSPVITVGTTGTGSATPVLDVTGLIGGGFTVPNGQTLAGTGTVNNTGAVVISSGGILSPGNNSVATLTLGALTLNNGSITNFAFGTSNSQVATTALTLNGIDGINLFQVGTTTKFNTPGVYTLFTYTSLSGTGAPPESAFSVLNPTAGQTYSFAATGSAIQLTISGNPPTTASWNVDADGNYSQASNWNPTVVPNSIGSTAIFGNVITAPRTVTVDGTFTLGEIDFNSVNAYTLAPAGAGATSLTLDNGGSIASIKDIAGSHTINVPLTLAAGVGITVTNLADTLTASSVISGTGPLNKDGAGILALTGANAYTGGTTITNGTVQINSNSSLGAIGGTATLNSSTNAVTLEALNSITTARNFALNGSNNNIQVDGVGGIYEIDGVIANIVAGAGALTKTGAGTLILSNDNTFTGITTISAGTLQLGIGGTTGSVGNLTGAIVNNATLVLNRSNDFTLANLISGTGSLTQAGADNVTLGAANTFSGNTTILAGSTLTLGNSLALQNSTLNYSSGTLSFGTQTSATLGELSGAQNLVLTNTAAAPVALTVGGNNGSTLYSGALSGTGSSLTKVGSGTLTLTGNNSLAFAQANSGTILVGTNGVLTTTGAIAAAGGASVVVNGGSLTAGALSTYGVNNVSSGIFDLVSGSATFNGGIQTAASDGSLFKVENGTFTATSVTLQRTASFTSLPTAASTTTGFYVTGGTANINGPLAIGTSNSSASARFDGGVTTVTGLTTIGATGGGRFNVLQVNGGSFTSTDATPNGGIIIAGANAANAQNAELLLTGGTTTANTVTFGQPTTGITSTGFLVLNGTAGNPATLYVGSGGIVNGASPTTNITPTITLTNGTVGATADWSTALPATIGTAVTFQAADASNAAHNITLNGALTGAGTLTKTGGGTLLLTNNNGFTGPTVINAGKLNASVTGALAATSAVTVNSGGTLLLSGAGTLNRVNNAAPITMGGGTADAPSLQLAHASPTNEGSGATVDPAVNNGVPSGTSVVGLGALTLSSSTFLDFGTGGVGTLVFSSFTPGMTAGVPNVLNILNYTSPTTSNGNVPNTSGVDNTDDRLIFNQDQTANLASFSFGGIGATQVPLDTGFFEVVPVPEPTTVLAGFLAVGALAWSQRRTLRKAFVRSDKALAA